MISELPPVGSVVALDDRCGPDPATPVRVPNPAGQVLTSSGLTSSGLAMPVSRFRVLAACWADQPAQSGTALLSGYQITDEGVTVASGWLAVNPAGVKVVEAS